MGNLFLCGAAGGGGGSVDIESMVSEAGSVSATGTNTATNTVNFTAPSKGILVVYYNRYKSSTSGGAYGTHTITQNGISITVSTSASTPTIFECAEGDVIVMKNTCYLKSSSTATSYVSGTKYAYLSYTFIPT